MNEKNLKLPVFLIAVALTVIAFAVVYKLNGKEISIGANSFTGSTSSATSTTSALPVLVLDTNGQRKFARITNDSNTTVYLYFGYFATPQAASTSVTLNKGIPLYASSSIEIDETKQYLGQIWATSTASAKVITFIEN